MTNDQIIEAAKLAGFYIDEEFNHIFIFDPNNLDPFDFDTPPPEDITGQLTKFAEIILASKDAELHRYKQELKSTQMMAECTDMLRSDLIEAGIIEKTVAPMFLTEAILGYIQASKASEMDKLKLSDLDNLPSPIHTTCHVCRGSGFVDNDINEQPKSTIKASGKVDADAVVEFCNIIIANHTSDAIFIKDQTAINVATNIREFVLKADIREGNNHEIT